MDILLIGLVAALASALTFFSGFGLGTLLLAAFSLFFPVPVAVAATGLVHLLNNLFKGGLLRKRADWRMVLAFGAPAVPAAMLGAWLLAVLGQSPRLWEWEAWGASFGPTGAGFAVGALMMLFAGLELHPGFAKLHAPARWMPLGGALTGFFGGLTGQQGALRSIFLLRAGLAPDRFIATGVMVAILVDLSRLSTYAASFGASGLDPAGREALLMAVGTISAAAVTFFAARRIEKVTHSTVRSIVAGMMLLIGAALVAGLLGSHA
jgi:uncharacterized membrane protein YfcA